MVNCVVNVEVETNVEIVDHSIGVIEVVLVGDLLNLFHYRVAIFIQPVCVVDGTLGVLPAQVNVPVELAPRVEAVRPLLNGDVHGASTSELLTADTELEAGELLFEFLTQNLGDFGHTEMLCLFVLATLEGVLGVIEGRLFGWGSDSDQIGHSERGDIK